MKAVCIKSYYDKCLHRSMTPGDELEVTEERFVELSGRKVVKKKEVSDVEYTQERAVGFLTLHSVIVMILMIRRTESSEMGQRFLLLSCITSPQMHISTRGSITEFLHRIILTSMQIRSTH